MSDIKRMHDAIEKLTSCMEKELENGVQNVDTEEMGKVVDIIKDLAEAEYYRTITVAMDESEYGEDYDYEGRKGYRGQPRDRKGRYMSRRRMGYEEPIHMMTPHMYKEHSPEYYRDMDRMDGRLYYTESGNMGGQSSSGMSDGSMGSQGGSRGYSESGRSDGGNYSSRMQDGGRDSREGRSGQSRRGYMEAKEQGKEKGEKMKNLEDYMKSIAEDITEAIEGASPEERSMTKQKLQMIAQKM